MLPNTRSGLALLATVTALVLLALNLSHWWPFLADDALISLRYSQRLLAGDGLTWTAGEWVEGYSNLSWVLICAAMGALGLELVNAARMLGVACVVACVLVSAWALRRAHPVAVLSAAWAAALSVPLAVWGQSGMETPLLAALVGGALALLADRVDRRAHAPKDLVLPALLLALACWTRPDTPALVGLVAFGFFLSAGQDLRAFRGAALLVGVSVVAIAVQVGLRQALYGEWLPNTYHAKVVENPLGLEQGMLYVWGWANAHLPVLGLGALGLFWMAPGTRETRRLVVPLVLGWPTVVVLLGGDHFPAWRWLAVLAVPLALLVGSGVGGVAARMPRASWLLLPPVVLVGGAVWTLQLRSPSVAIVRYEGWSWEQQEVGLLFEEAFGSGQPLLATGAAGGLPFWSGLPALDMLGLCDAHIARTEPRFPMAGHAKGDSDYVLDRAPDLVMVCAARGGVSGCVPQETELLEHPRFQENYRMVRLLLDEDRPVEPWVRWDSERLGVRVEEGRVELPGWMLSGSEGLGARLEGGVLGLPLEKGAEARLGLPLEGLWRVEAGEGLFGEALSGPEGLTVVLRAEASTLVGRVVLVREP